MAVTDGREGTVAVGRSQPVRGAKALGGPTPIVLVVSLGACTGEGLLHLPGGFFELGCALVYGLAERLAWFEVRDTFFRDGNGFSAAGIAAHSGRTMVDREASESADLDTVTAYECFANGIQDGLHSEFGIAMCQLAKAGSEFLDEVGAGHGIL